jgi:polygalacturonase
MFAATTMAIVAWPVVDKGHTPSPYGGRVGPTYNLLDFGAKGDNKTLNTASFEKAIAQMEVAGRAGGGTLYVPDGVFITGPFNLTSKMTLFLSGGATIRGPTTEQLGPSPEFPLWPIIPAMPSYGQGRDHPGPRRTSLLHGEHLNDVIVTSHPGAWGTIDGHGQPWWDAHKKKTETVTRGHLIEFMHSSNIEISHLKLRNSPFWTVHPVYCNHVVVRNIDVKAPHDSPNTDGVDPESSEDVLIENFTYEGGDDVIAIKSGWDCFGYQMGKPCKNIHIRNVTSVWTRAAGCAIGSEMSGGMENITVTDCDFKNTASTSSTQSTAGGTSRTSTSPTL